MISNVLSSHMNSVIQWGWVLTRGFLKKGSFNKGDAENLRKPSSSFTHLW